MIYSIMLGIMLATADAPPMTAVAAISPLIVAQAVWQIAFKKSPITGVESHYALYIQGLLAQGDSPPRPWIGFMLLSLAFHIPIALVVYFAVAYFR